MPATVVVAPQERPAFAFALLRASAFFASGTAEERESAAALRQMLLGLEGTLPGTVEMEFLTQDAYLMGIRHFYTLVELEEYWLDACARASGAAVADDIDPELDQAVQQYFAEIRADPVGFQFDMVRGTFTDLGLKLDAAVTAGAPRARAMYNSDREEMSNKAIEIRERNARARATPASVRASAVAVGARPAADMPAWGVDVRTGLAPADIPLDSFRAMTIGSVKLLLTNYGGSLAALSGSCTHQQTGIAKGRLSGTIIECPRHGAEFDLRDGQQVCPPFCQRWMERRGALGRFLAMVTPNKRGGDLPRFPLWVEDGEIVLHI